MKTVGKVLLPACVITALVIVGLHQWEWFEVHTGTVNESGPYYGFWSGFGSDISEILAPVIVLVGLWRSHNCQAHGCWRIGRHDYEMDGVVHKLCKHCHPGLKGQHHTREVFHAYHAAQNALPVVEPGPTQNPNERFVSR